MHQWIDSYPVEYLWNPSQRLFEMDMYLSTRFRSLLQDDQFAQGVTDVINSRQFCTLDGCLLLQITNDGIRALVAQLRGKGETYRDFIAGIVHPCRYDVPMILQALEEIGWREAAEAEIEIEIEMLDRVFRIGNGWSDAAR
jgi:hypothetical protein